MKIKFLLNEIKMEDVLSRFKSKKFVNKLSYDFEKYHKQMKRNDFFLSIWDFVNENNKNKLITLILDKINELDIIEQQKPIAINFWIKLYLTNGWGEEPESDISFSFSNLYNFIYGDLDEIEDFFKVQRFIEPPEKRDLMNIKTLDELLYLINQAWEKYKEWNAINRSKKLKDKAEYRKVHEDNEFSIYIPDNKDAACLLGLGTKWCTASTTSKNWYPEYTEDGDPLFILISKNDPKNRYQFSFIKNDLANQLNDRLADYQIANFMNKYHKVFEQYSSYFKTWINYKAPINQMARWASHLGIKKKNDKYPFYAKSNGELWCFELIPSKRNKDEPLYLPAWVIKLKRSEIFDNLVRNYQMYYGNEEHIMNIWDLDI